MSRARFLASILLLAVAAWTARSLALHAVRSTQQRVATARVPHASLVVSPSPPAIYESPRQATGDKDTALVATRHIRGQVVGEDGLPREATVCARIWDHPYGVCPTASSGTDGRFDLPVPKGQYTPFAVAPGYLSSRLQNDISQDKDVDGVVLHLTRSATILGTITGPDGRPIRGADVWCTVSYCYLISGTTSDDTGGYRLEANPGPIAIHARAEHLAPHAEVVEFAAGEEARVDIRISRALRVTGTVTDSAGAPVVGSRVVIAGEAGVHAQPYPSYIDTQTDSKGQYLLDGLAPGKHSLFAGQAFREVQLTGDAQEDFQVHEHGELHGRVLRKRDGTIVTSYSIRTHFDPEFTETNLLWPNENWGCQPFKIYGVPPGTLIVRVHADGLADTQSEPIVVKEGVPIPDIVIEMGEGATLKGSIRSSRTLEALHDAWVWPLSGGGGVFDWPMPTPGFCSPVVSPLAETVGSGFEVPHLPPGPAKFRVECKGHATREFTVDIPDSGVVENDFLLDDGVTIHGRVITEGGAAPAEAWLVVISSGARWEESLKAGSNGSFEIRGIAPGNCYIHFDTRPPQMAELNSIPARYPERDPFETRGPTLHIQVPTEGSVELNVVLREGARVHGIAMQGGVPIEQRQIVLRGRDARAGEVYFSVTDAAGRYTVESMEPGSYQVSLGGCGITHMPHGVGLGEGEERPRLTVAPGCADVAFNFDLAEKQ